MNRLIYIFIFFFIVQSGTHALAREKLIYKDFRARKVLLESKGTEKEQYFYDPSGKPDPFFPFVLLGKKSLKELKMQPSTDHYTRMLALLEEMRTPKTELQKIDISDITLTAIIRKGNKVMAMVRGPEKPMGYLIKKGTFIGKNGGVVEDIISEERNTELGKQIIRKVIIKEPYLDQDGKIKYRRVELNMP